MATNVTPQNKALANNVNIGVTDQKQDRKDNSRREVKEELLIKKSVK
jgi:hypothetical protein